MLKYQSRANEVTSRLLEVTEDSLEKELQRLTECRVLMDAIDLRDVHSQPVYLGLLETEFDETRLWKNWQPSWIETHLDGAREFHLSSGRGIPLGGGLCLLVHAYNQAGFRTCGYNGWLVTLVRFIADRNRIIPEILNREAFLVDVSLGNEIFNSINWTIFHAGETYGRSRTPQVTLFFHGKMGHLRTMLLRVRTLDEGGRITQFDPMANSFLVVPASFPIEPYAEEFKPRLGLATGTQHYVAALAPRKKVIRAEGHAISTQVRPYVHIRLYNNTQNGNRLELFPYELIKPNGPQGGVLLSQTQDKHPVQIPLAGVDERYRTHLRRLVFAVSEDPHRLLIAVERQNFPRDEYPDAEYYLDLVFIEYNPKRQTYQLAYPQLPDEETAAMSLYSEDPSRRHDPRYRMIRKLTGVQSRYTHASTVGAALFSYLLQELPETLPSFRRISVDDPRVSTIRTITYELPVRHSESINSPQE